MCVIHRMLIDFLSKQCNARLMEWQFGFGESDALVHTWDFSIVALCLSHIGDMSIPCSLSRSPWQKNSSIIFSTQRLYNPNGLVGLLKSAQWTMFCRTYENSGNTLETGAIRHKNVSHNRFMQKFTCILSV